MAFVADLPLFGKILANFTINCPKFHQLLSQLTKFFAHLLYKCHQKCVISSKLTATLHFIAYLYKGVKMATHTVLIGDFAPLHLGHLQDINAAMGAADRVFVIVKPPASPALPSNRTPNEKDVIRWLQVATQAFDFVEIFSASDLGLADEFDYQSSQNIATQTLQALQSSLAVDDFILCSKNALQNNDLQTHILPKTTQDSLPIHKQPLKFFDHLATSCRYFYTQTVCIVGGESSGKTVLVHKLANHFGATVALEMGRLYAHTHLGGSELALQYSDYTPIAIEHAAAIERAKRSASAPITLIDTDFVTTQVFCETYEQRSDGVVAAFADTMRMDFTIYLDNNVAWVADGTRRLGGASRSTFAQKLLDTLQKHHITPFVIDSADYHERYLQAVDFIERQILAE